MPFSVRFERNKAGSLAGHITQVSGNLTEEMKFEGSIDGNYIDTHTTTIEKGAARKLTFKGYVLDGQVILQVGGTTSNGSPASGYVLIKPK